MLLFDTCCCLGAPEIVLSEQKRFVLKTPGKLSVDVGSTVYAVRGTDITVSCKASASPDYGEIKIEWLMHGTPVTDRFRGDVAAIDGALRIRRVGLFNEGTYTCRASNDAGATEALFTVKRVSEYDKKHVFLNAISFSGVHIKFGF